MNPLISIVVPTFNIAPEYLVECIDSVINQTYNDWELILCDDCSTSKETLDCLETYRGTDPRIIITKTEFNSGIAGATNRAIEFSSAPFISFLDNDDTIAVNAIQEIVNVINLNNEVDYIYTDEDKIDENGDYCDTYFKPDWSPEHLKSCMYLLHFVTIRKSLLCKLGMLRPEFDGAQDYDLALRATSQARKIIHIPKILYHWRKIEGSASAEVDAKPKALTNAKRALENITDTTVEHSSLPGIFRVRNIVPEGTKVALTILTNDGERHLEGRGVVKLLPNLVESIVEKTSYEDYEIIIAHDGLLSNESKERIDALKANISYRSYERGEKSFNFAHKFNSIWPSIDSEIIVLMNDDMEVISTDWIEALLEPAQDPKVAVVGGRLLHADRTIQHVGVVLGVNQGAAHIYHCSPEQTIGYNGFTHCIRNYSAVTGACMLIKKNMLRELGGFDESFATDYNDIDFCLKITKAGFRVVYTPYCELFHFECSSIKRTVSCPEGTKLFNQRWHHLIANDPYYNPNLPRNRHDFVFD